MAAAFLSATAADPTDAAQGGTVYGRRKYRSRAARFGARTDLTGSHCPYGRSGTEISRPATANIHETSHIGRWRARLHRYGRIRRAVYPASGARQRQRAQQLGLLVSPG